MSNMKRDLIRLASISPDARPEILNLVKSLGSKTASTKDMMGRLIRLAYSRPDRPWFQSELIRLAKGESKETFEGWVKGKKFRNPDTGNRVVFKSLPEGQQEKIREHWGEKNRGGTDEDKEYGAKTELPKDYHMSIVGDNEERAAYVAKKIQEGIDRSADICQMTPAVCEDNLGITRDNMPQVLDKPIKDLMNSDKEGDKKKAQAYIDAGGDPDDPRPPLQQLLDDLKEEGVKQTKKKVPVGKLKATQQEIKAGKSFGMANAYYEGKFDPSKNVEIVISKDGHILDGHHRWASLLIADPDKAMSCIEVDMTMKDFLKRSFEQPGVFRADLQDNIVDDDKPVDFGDGKPFHPKRKNKGKGMKNKKKAGRPIGKGRNGYIAFYRGKQVEVMADTQLEARDLAAEHFRARRPYDVSVVLAEVRGEQVTHMPIFANRQARLEELRARVAAESPSIKKFLEQHGDRKIRNPDTGNDVKIRSLTRSERGGRLFWRLYEDWLDSQSEDKEKKEDKGSKPVSLTKSQSKTLSKSLEGWGNSRSWSHVTTHANSGKPLETKHVESVLKDINKYLSNWDAQAERNKWSDSDKRSLTKAKGILEKAKGKGKKARLEELRARVAKGKVPEALKEHQFTKEEQGPTKGDDPDGKKPWEKGKKARVASLQHTSAYNLEDIYGKKFFGAEHGFDVEF